MHSINLITRRMRTKYLCIGIGGFDCYCCCPPKKILKRLGRMGRHKIKFDLNKFEKIAEGE